MKKKKFSLVKVAQKGCDDVIWWHIDHEGSQLWVCSLWTESTCRSYYWKGRGKKPRWCWIEMKLDIMLLLALCVKWKMVCACVWEVEKKDRWTKRVWWIIQRSSSGCLGGEKKRGFVCVNMFVCASGVEATDWGCTWIRNLQRLDILAGPGELSQTFPFQK